MTVQDSFVLSLANTIFLHQNVAQLVESHSQISCNLRVSSLVLVKTDTARSIHSRLEVQSPHGAADACWG